MSDDAMTPELIAAMAVLELALRMVAAAKDDPTPEQIEQVRSRAGASDARFDALLAKVGGGDE
ncbi:MAG: hypothetical protein ACIAXF_14195 [Phycisphaerales bacterium JB063]